MPIFSKGNKKILFVHIPKTGGITINHIFIHNGWQIALNDYIGKHEYFANTREGSLTHLTQKEICEYYRLEEFDFSFSIVRNPYERAVSEYHWQKQTVDFNTWFTQSMKENSQTVFPQKYRDNHFLPQTDFIDDSISTVFKLEQGMQSIAEMIETQAKIKFEHVNFHANLTDKTITVDDIDKSLVYNAYIEDFERFGYDPTR